MFGGDIRKDRVQAVMSMARILTLAEMKSVLYQLTTLHDLIVMNNDPRWEKPRYEDGMEDCGR